MTLCAMCSRRFCCLFQGEWDQLAGSSLPEWRTLALTSPTTCMVDSPSVREYLLAARRSCVRSHVEPALPLGHTPLRHGAFRYCPPRSVNVRHIPLLPPHSTTVHHVPIPNKQNCRNDLPALCWLDCRLVGYTDFWCIYSVAFVACTVRCKSFLFLLFFVLCTNKLLLLLLLSTTFH